MRTGTAPLITIRRTQIEDREPIRAILEDTDVFNRDEIEIAMELIDAFLSDPNKNDYNVYSAIDPEGDVVGYTCIGPTPLTDGTFDLYWIAVKPSTHQRGIGKELLKYSEDLAGAHGGRLLIAETSSQPKYENTRAFYLRNSYLEIARIKDYYKIGDDLVVYGKYLSQHRGT